MKLPRHLSIMYALLLAVFVSLVISLPPSTSVMAHYHLTVSQFHEFILVIELPLILVWLSALYAYKKIRSYAIKITDSPEEKGFNGLAKGCLWLAWGLPISAVVTLALNFYAHEASRFVSTANIVSNYLNLLFAILAFTIMSEGTRHLIKMYDIRKSNRRKEITKQLVLVIIGIIYCFLILRNFTFQAMGSSDNPYFLPAWLLIISFVIPYLYAWFMGMLTALDVLTLARHTPGVLYKRALRLVAGGVVMVIVSLMAVQYIRAWLPKGINSLSVVIVSIYLTYTVCAVGFLLVVNGIAKMQKIEEV